MKRRDLLARLAGLAGLGTIAGCVESVRPSGPRTPPHSPTPTETPATGVVVADFAPNEGGNGDLVVSVTVENKGTQPASVQVVVEATAGDESATASESVTVAAGERRQVTVETDLAYEAFSASGSLQVRVE